LRIISATASGTTWRTGITERILRCQLPTPNLQHPIPPNVPRSRGLKV